MRGRAERRILSALREGRREAYEAIIDAHYASVYRFLLLLTHDGTLAEDLTQEVFTAAWKGLGGFEGRASIKTWLHRIAYHTFVDNQRQQNRRAACTEGLDLSRPEAVCDPVASLETAEDLVRVQDALEGLEMDDRSVLVLHYVEGLSYREMADVLDRPSGTVKWLTGRALARLRHQLAGKAQP